MSHTAGEWKVHKRMKECVTFQGKQGEENLFTQNVDGYFCCQNEDDARLISAAKELLEELQETHAALCFIPDYIGTLRHERNMAAIAKAQGNES